MHDIDLGLLIIRIATGGMIFLHGYNHFFGGGRLPGAGRWFDSLGIRPGIVHAWVTASVEVLAGIGFAIGLLTPIAGAGIVGIMAVAGIVVHRRNGFFIVKEGYEYVLYISLVVAAVGAMGPGAWSVDHAFGFHVTGWAGIALSFGLGVVSALGLLAVFWRPPAKVAKA
ncbi:MAG: DoxX family protein [Acidimicrobiales bacterium]